jgi:hypothetical protein
MYPDLIQILINLHFSALRNMITGPDAQNRRLAAIEPTTVLQLLIRAAPNLSDTSPVVSPSEHYIDYSYSGTSGSGMDIHQVRSARAYYTDVNKSRIGGGLELWQGFFQ